MRFREAGHEACCRKALGGKRIGPFASRLLAKRIEKNGECGAAADEIQRLSIAAVVKSPMFTVVSPQDLDKTLKDGLGLRWSFLGPFATIATPRGKTCADASTTGSPRCFFR